MSSAAYLAGRYGLNAKVSPAHISGFIEIWRQDAIRSSCMECVEKHLGSALVLMSEAETGYPSHKLLAIGHLHEASEESAKLRPKLSAKIRAIRKAYQAGEPVDLDAIVEALQEHGVWRFDRRGEGVACGRGWISRRKKCSKEKSAITSKENKLKTREKQKSRQALRRQVEMSKGQRPYVKPQSKQRPDEPPHKNPQTPQQYIENGRAIAGDFLDKAPAYLRNLEAVSQVRAKAAMDYSNLKIQKRDEIKAAAYFKASKDPRYQELDRQESQLTRQLWQNDRDREQGLIGVSESARRERQLLNQRAGISRQIREIRRDYENQALDELPDVKTAKRNLEAAKKAEATIAAPAQELKNRLLATSTLSRENAEKIVKGIQKPSGYRKNDPSLPNEIADFLQITNGKGSRTLNRVTMTRQRAHATWNGLIRYPGAQGKRTLWHEMGHNVEFDDWGDDVQQMPRRIVNGKPSRAKITAYLSFKDEDRTIAKTAMDWVKQRAATTQGVSMANLKPASLRKLTGNKAYKSSEKAYDGGFVSPYVGKTYELSGGRRGRVVTEVISMGIQSFSDPKDMIDLAAKDPDHLAFVLGAIRK